MMKKDVYRGLAKSLCFTALLGSGSALAVGGGVPFGVDEAGVPGSLQHTFMSDSMDFTYHGCVRVSNEDSGAIQGMREHGYFHISSYQDADSVVDSQINFFLAMGYHIYGVYQFTANHVGTGMGPLGTRTAYDISNAGVRLFADPNSDTVIAQPNCQQMISNNADDWLIGGSGTLMDGEKSEKDGLANGDFEIVLGNWNWINPAPLVPFSPMPVFHMNANVTTIIGPLDGNHQTEGSGNIFWLND